MRLIPMFPLGTVLFPGVYLPLHVFEPRYRQLVGEAVAGATVPIDDEPVLASYQMAALAPLGPLDQQTLLGAETALDRLDLLGRLLEEEEAVLARRLAGG